MVTVEALTGSQRRLRWIAEQKKAMVLETEPLGMNVSVVARKCEVHHNQLFRRRSLFHEGALTAISADEELVPFSLVKELKGRIRELERMLFIYQPQHFAKECDLCRIC
jgi:transposase-like protein